MHVHPVVLRFGIGGYMYIMYINQPCKLITITSLCVSMKAFCDEQSHFIDVQHIRVLCTMSLLSQLVKCRLYGWVKVLTLRFIL